MMSSIFTILFLIVSVSVAKGPVDFTKMEAGRKDNHYLAWIYFADKLTGNKSETKKVSLSPNAILRRQKSSFGEKIDWFDYYPAIDYVEALRSTGAKIRKQSRWLNAVSVVVDKSQLTEISQFPFVKQISPVLTYRRTISHNQRRVRLPPRLKTADMEYGYSQGQMEQINCLPAHDAGYYGQYVTILILDTGFNLEHPAFDSLNVVGEWDFIEDDSSTADDSTLGQHNHGTMVLSTLAGYAPGNLIGPAFKAKFLLAKTEIVGQEIQIEEDNYIAGLEWGEARGADVVSSSLGYMDWYDYSDMDGNTAVTTRAIDMAVQLFGIVCVTAAGNEGNDNWFYIIAPADADSVISVGGVRPDSLFWTSSSHGPTFDGRIKPEVCAQASSVACVSPFSDGYTHSNGTSLATPLVSGAAAVVLSAHPDWTPMMVREAFMKTASRASSPDNSYGYGIINVWAAINFNNFGDTVETPGLPDQFVLSTGYPNPFNPAINFTVKIPRSANVKVNVYNIRGQLIESIMEGTYASNSYTVSWNGNNYPSGLYFVRMEWNNDFIMRKALLLK